MNSDTKHPYHPTTSHEAETHALIANLTAQGWKRVMTGSIAAMRRAGAYDAQELSSWPTHIKRNEHGTMQAALFELWHRPRDIASRVTTPTTHTCAYCGGTRFHEGPHGAGSTNLLCANPQCRHWWNDMGPFGLQDLHRVEPEAT